MSAGRRVNTLSVHWCTPPKYQIPITEFLEEIELDPCSNPQSIINAKVNLMEKGLQHDWTKYKTIYVNPPYGRNGDTSIYDWIKKAYLTYIINPNLIQIILLIPVATNTKHWKDYVFKANIICFLKDTRLKFLLNGDIDNKGASMSCSLVYFGKRELEFISKFSDYGICCKSIQTL